MNAYSYNRVHKGPITECYETLVRYKIMRSLDVNEVTANCQHGFIKNKSSFMNLLMTLEGWISAVDHGHGVDVAYLDFSKVSDSVPHQRLLANYGFRGQLLCWLKGFLYDCCQRVILSGSSSNWCPGCINFFN